MTTADEPRVTDVARLGAVQKLCDLAHPYEVGSRESSLFVEAMREITRWHRERSPFYARLLEKAALDLGSLRSVEDCARLPLVPAVFFKSHEAVSIDRSEVHAHLTSSGTTGQKSQMFFDRWTLGSAQRMVDFIYRYNGWETPAEKTNYLLYTYETETERPIVRSGEADSKLGTAYTDNFLCKYAPRNEIFYALRLTGSKGETHSFDVFGTIERLRSYASQGLPVRIFGFPAFLYFTLERMRDLGMEPLKLSAQSLVFLGGGWKGHADQAIRKQDLYAMASHWLGIPDERLRDGFGSVEHCVPYVECRNHQFHVPVWSRIFVRDVRTLEPLPPGQPGFMNFISPYITSVPAHSVLMGDLVSWGTAESCGCDLGTPFFTVLGRAGTSKNKSCAVAAAELLRKAT
jgi:phenylacetate-coenzyme A ligase PaaK-like adenylate-forming protein